MSRKTMFPLLFLIYGLLAANLTSHVHSASLNLVAYTDKGVYNVGEIIQVTGNLTLDGSPVPDGLVALQINDRLYPYIYRTLHTGTIPTTNWKIEITDAYIGDSYGNPISSVKIGSTYRIWVWYQNNWINPIHTVIAFTIYDGSQVPLFALAPAELWVNPGGPYPLAYDWLVPAEAELGTGAIHASAFTDFPKEGGYPHCPEKMSTFTITLSSGALSLTEYFPTEISQQIQGTFNTSFRFSTKTTRLGDYTIYVAASYAGLQTARTFPCFTAVLIGDINGDKYVSAKDSVIYGSAFGSQPGDPNWDERADIKKDNFINAKDGVLLGSNFGHSAR